MARDPAVQVKLATGSSGPNSCHPAKLSPTAAFGCIRAKRGAPASGEIVSATAAATRSSRRGFGVPPAKGMPLNAGELGPIPRHSNARAVPKAVRVALLLRENYLCSIGYRKPKSYLLAPPLHCAPTARVTTPLALDPRLA